MKAAVRMQGSQARHLHAASFVILKVAPAGAGRLCEGSHSHAGRPGAAPACSFSVSKLAGMRSAGSQELSFVVHHAQLSRPGDRNGRACALCNQGRQS